MKALNFIHFKKGASLFRRMKELGSGAPLLETLLHKCFLELGSHYCVLHNKRPEKFRLLTEGYEQTGMRESKEAITQVINKYQNYDLDAIKVILQEAGCEHVFNMAVQDIVRTIEPYFS